MHKGTLSTTVGIALLAAALAHLWLALYLTPPPPPGATVLALSPPTNDSTCLANDSRYAPEDALLDPLTLALGPLPPSMRLSVRHTPSRAAEIRLMRRLIANEPRVWRVGGVGASNGLDMPFYDGPVARPGSLAARIRQHELAQVQATMPETARLLGALASTVAPSLTSADAFERFYESFSLLMDAPGASLNLSDEFVGAQRLSVRGFSLRRVDGGLGDDVHRGPETLSDAQVAVVCGENATLPVLLASGSLFVVDLSEMRQYQPTDSRKFTPSVVAHFCLNRARGGRLLPLTITLLDSGLTYSRFDAPSDWALAKVALNAAETTQQQLAHFVETHALTIPLRVELYRSLAARHPVRALLSRHFALDFALEGQAGVLLFNASTPLDRTFGLGAVGCVQLINRELASMRAANRALRWGGDGPDVGPVEHDRRARGLLELPHKYAEYAQLHFLALANFSRAFVDAFYADDGAVGRDVELQSWIQASSRIRHLRGAFPTRVRSKTRLTELLARLVFIATVRHHAMNGEATWETLAMPYSAPALWKPLPSAKSAGGDEGNNTDLLSYLQPADRFADLVFLSAVFNRPRATEHSLYGAYAGGEGGSDVLGAETRLRTAVDEYERELRAIDARIVDQESGESWPYHILRPARLPHNNWI